MQDPTTPPTIAPDPPQMEITASQAETVASWITEDLARGKMTPEQAAKAFDEMATPDADRVPDTCTAAEKELDSAFPPAKERDYTIRYNAPGDDAREQMPELKAFDQSARTWLAGAQFPREVGNSLVSAISKVLQHTRAMTADQLNTYGENEYVKLQRAYGDQLEDKLRQTGRMIQDLDAKTPGLKHLLKSKAIGDNTLIVSMLVQQYAIYHARKGH